MLEEDLAGYIFRRCLRPRWVVSVSRFIGLGLKAQQTPVPNVWEASGRVRGMSMLATDSMSRRTWKKP